MGTGSKRKGKRGEKGARLFLEEKGWYIAHEEVQGLSGDDLFARDPTGKWWSIEVKNTTGYSPKYIAQARRQAQERYYALQKKMKADVTDAEVMRFLGMDTFTQGDFLVMWHPSNANARAGMWVAIVKEKHAYGYIVFISPFSGSFDDYPTPYSGLGNRSSTSTGNIEGGARKKQGNSNLSSEEARAINYADSCATEDLQEGEQL
jgi:Holliday junction resolvase-like predicted endonuclease